MAVKRFYAADMHTALNNNCNQSGANAAILATRQLADGVEVSAAAGTADSDFQSESSAKSEFEPNSNPAFSGIQHLCYLIQMDADLGIANVDLLLRVKAKKNGSDVLAGDRDLQDILISATGDIKVIPASTGTPQFASMSLQYEGRVLFDDSEREAVMRQKVKAFPGSKSSIACKKPTKSVRGWLRPGLTTWTSEVFWSDW